MTTDLPDVNVLTALHVTGHPHHHSAVQWFDSAQSVVLTPITQTGLLRMLLNPSVNPECRAAVAISKITNFMKIPSVSFYPDEINDITDNKFLYALNGYKQVTDLHLLALAASNGWQLVIFDMGIESALRPHDRRHIRVLTETAKSQRSAHAHLAERPDE